MELILEAVRQSNDMTGNRAGGFPEIVCPADHSPLTRSAQGSLLCAHGHEYPNTLGIPRLLAVERNYADAFGEQWKKFRSTQLDSYSGTSISADRLRRCLGSEQWEALQASGRVEVLEAGCGAGRFTEIMLQLRAVSLTSTDISVAVEPNQTNCPQSDRHRVIQCDINAAPFLAEQFDLVVCLGVIQHTPNPEQTIASLYRQVRPGGVLIIDHYGHSLSRYTKVTALMLRPILKRLSPQRSLAFVETLTRLFFPLHRLVRGHRVLQMIVSRVSPITTYFHALPQLDDRRQFEWACLDTHDGLTDYYKHLRTGSQIRRTLMRLGAIDVTLHKGGNGIECRCRKPSRAASGQ